MRHADGEPLTRMLLDAVRDAGVRVILAQNNSTIGAGLHDSPDVFMLRDYPIPHHVLFPRLKAAVHHGSWIATHLAAQAGIPQLVLPQASDQYLWANVVWKNGLGPRGVDMNRMRAKKLSAAIEQLTHDRAYESNARALAHKVSGIDGAKNAVRLFEELQGRLPARLPVSRADHSLGVVPSQSGRRWARLSGGYLRRRLKVGSHRDVERLDTEYAARRSAALHADDNDEAAGER
jgi:UDP:flavonoid glycosyltransferase YjiC (YdhE family)